MVSIPTFRSLHKLKIWFCLWEHFDEVCRVLRFWLYDLLSYYHPSSFRSFNPLAPKLLQLFFIAEKKMSAWFLVSCWVGVWVTTSVSLAVFWVVFEPHFNHKKLLLQPFWKLNRHFGMAVHCTFLHYKPKVMFRSSKFVPLWKFLISTGVALDSCREAPENPNDLKITRLFAYQVTFGWEK